MRMSRDAAAASKRRILDAAARMLRERGVAETSIADVMQAAGMKHGGFYKHFASKEDLVRQAIGTAFEQRVATFDATRAAEGETAAIRLEMRCPVMMPPPHGTCSGQGRFQGGWPWCHDSIRDRHP